MATPDQVRMLKTAEPFRKFTVHMAGGRSFTIDHPENVARDKKGREMVIIDDEGSHYLEMLLVDVIEPVIATGGGNGAAGNGD
jgi:hypothetical protein